MKNEDNAKTVVRTRRMPFRPAPGSDPEQSVNVLPVGTHLGEFEILDLIGEGGFGIVYLAYDHSLERHVALKEYMPSGLATRTTSMAVTVRSQHNAATFTAGLKSFINEARMLAQFDSPSLVKVHRFWEGNGTAYMVMPFYEGTTLKQALKERRITPSESWIRVLLADLFDAIETIHHAHCLHRDIAPDNILLLKDGRPLLLDFGAARRVIGDLTQCLTVILKPGFAPIEQYADIAGLRQGEWTDIYALAAVVYYLITGKAPPPAVARMVHDELVPARKAGKGRYSDAFLGALDKALSVKPEQRFRSIDELRRAMDIMETVPRTLPRDNAHWATTVVRTTVKPEPRQHSQPAQGAPAVPPSQHAQYSQPSQPSQPSRPSSSYVRAEPRFGTLPHAPATPASSPDQEITQYLHSAGPIETEWRSSPRTEHTYAPARRKKTEWLVLGLLLSAGVASGVYVGINRSWKSADDTMTAVAGKPAMESSGASEVPEEEPAKPEPAPRAPAPSPAPAASAPVVTPPPVVAASPRPAQVPAPSPIAAAPAPRPTETGAPLKDTQRASLTPGQQSEIDLWRAASASDKPSAYEHYLREYPKGRYASLARIRLERKLPRTAMAAPAETAAAATRETPKATIRKEQATREPAMKEPEAKEPATKEAARKEPAPKEAPRSAEEELWTTVTSINDGPAYEAYLYQYPRGRYAALARDKLASVDAPKQAAAAPAPPPVAATPTTPPAPDQAAERALAAKIDRQASVKPAEPAAPPPASKTTTEPAPSTAEPPAASARKVIRTENQTMTGDFTADPRTGIVSGSGRIVWSNGDQFEGTLVNGKKEGKGKFIWANGQRYTGDWSRDTPNGKGTIVFTDGSRYEGDVKDGVPHGQGITRFKDGDVYRGGWVRGRSHGQGRYTWANGSYWEGEFRDDKRTENGKMVFAGNATGAPPAMREAQSAAPAPASRE